MATSRKQVAFDLDTNALKTYYPSENWNNAYYDIRQHMEKNGFQWQQGSVYVSQKPMRSLDVTMVLLKLVNENSWLNVCMRDCRETNIGKENDKNHLFDKTANIPTREEVKNANTDMSKEAPGSKKTMSMNDYMAEIEKMKAEARNNPDAKHSLTHTKSTQNKTDR